MTSKFIDLTGKQFGEWVVIGYAGDKKWHCKCSCGTEKNILGRTLRNGESKSCGCIKKQFNDLTGQHIGEWSVLYRNDNRTYMCRCSCGTEKIVQAYHLIHGVSKSCGHSTNKLEDLTGKQFGELSVIKYIGDRKWECRCSCGKIVNILAQQLKSGSTRSCGCKSYELLKETLINKYGDTVPTRVSNPREKWQIDVLSSKENFEAYILNKRINNDKTDNTIYQLADELGVTHSAVLHRLEQFGIKHLVNLHCNTSRFEKEILNKIKRYYDGDIVTQARDIITPYELDIYIPEKRLAFEINGNHWHSDDYKDKDYHQQKTIACAKQGIRLIHIFEYEIVNNKDRLYNFVDNIINDKKNIIYARNTDVKIVTDNYEIQTFLNMYHLQGHFKADINVILTNNEEIVALMSFDKPRFNNNYAYEVIRLCFKPNTYVIGGVERMTHHFLSKYNPKSVITYVDISKFTGNGYIKAGFKLAQDCITQPGYVWCNDRSEIKSRYSTQKKRLLKNGVATEDDTEDTAMRRLGYYKIYNCGVLKLEITNE